MGKEFKAEDPKLRKLRRAVAKVDMRRIEKKLKLRRALSHHVWHRWPGFVARMIMGYLKGIKAPYARAEFLGNVVKSEAPTGYKPNDREYKSRMDFLRRLLVEIYKKGDGFIPDSELNKIFHSWFGPIKPEPQPHLEQNNNDNNHDAPGLA